MSRPVPLHRETHPHLDEEGCFGCKATSIGFGAVPDGGSNRSRVADHAKMVEGELHQYRDMRNRGENPGGTTKKAMERTKYKHRLWEDHADSIKDFNPPEKVKQIAGALDVTE